MIMYRLQENDAQPDPSGGGKEMILLAIEDITERAGKG
jgi:hypothetical protein